MIIWLLQWGCLLQHKPLKDLKRLGQILNIHFMLHLTIQLGEIVLIKLLNLILITKVEQLFSIFLLLLIMDKLNASISSSADKYSTGEHIMVGFLKKMLISEL